MAWWEWGAAFNALIGMSYLAIVWTILVGLRDTRQLTSNRLALATAGIFFTCAVHHGSHTVSMLLPSLGLARSEGLSMRRAFGSHMVVWDLVGAAVAVYYLTLRRSYDRLLTSPQMFEDRVREQATERLRGTAYTDPVTGLPNRAAFTERLTELSRDWSGSAGLLFLDLDRFKDVNDTLGHGAGDALLHGVGHRVRTALRAQDELYRIGGDEFTVLCCAAGDDPMALARRIGQTLEAPFVVDEHELHIGASIGVAKTTSLAEVGDLLRRADTAMYRAKDDGRATVRLFDSSMSDDGYGLTMSNDLAKAVREDQLELDYQPIIDLESGQVVGAEALVRWRHPTRGRLAPAEFIGYAEQTGHVLALGRWVLSHACADAARWRPRAEGEAPFVTVNVSAPEVESDGFVAAVREALAAAGLPPARLWLEVTERTAGRDAKRLAARLWEVTQLGVRVALDDFGTGWASLSHVHELPVSMIKIDRSFVAGVPGSAAYTLARSITVLASSLDVVSVAEGIETEEQLEGVRALGCGWGQGYLLGRPGPATAFDQLTALTLPLPRRPATVERPVPAAVSGARTTDPGPTEGTAGR